MSLSERKDNCIEVEIQGTGPRLFAPEDYRGWIEEEIRGTDSHYGLLGFRKARRRR
jgi:hypothetical protein